MKPKNQSQLAKALGVSRQALNHHFKRAGAPPVNDVEAWQKYLAVHGATPGVTLPTDLRRAIGEQRLGILKIERANAEDKRARDKGELILWRDVDEFIRAFISELFQSLDQTFTFELPPALKGLDEAQMSERCRAEIERLKKNLRDRHESFELEHRKHD